MARYDESYLIITCDKRKPLEKLRRWFLSRLYDKLSEDVAEMPDFGDYVGGVTRSVGYMSYCLFIPDDDCPEGSAASVVIQEIREELQAKIIKHNSEQTEYSNKIKMIQVTVEEPVLEDRKPFAEYLVGG